MKILVINGPNINMLGIREPDVYGTNTFRDLLRLLDAAAEEFSVEVDQYQSNHEGCIVDKIQQTYGCYDAIIINPAAYTHTFCEAYALMLAKVKNRYPNAEIYCLNILDRKSLLGDKTRIDAFNGYIETIAEKNGAYLVDIYRESGITADSVSCTTYIADDVLHPSTAGMDAISNCLISAIYENSKYIPEDFRTCSVTYDLKKVIVMEGTPELVQKGASFNCTMYDGLSTAGVDITVTMGGKDITEQCVNKGKVSIEKVTGDLVITAE